jgi:hypothetical protein
MKILPIETKAKGIDRIEIVLDFRIVLTFKYKRHIKTGRKIIYSLLE